MANVLFTVPCSAANAALGGEFVYRDLRVRSEERVCVRKELGGCFVAGKDAIWDVGIGPGCRGQEASCQKWGGIFAFSFPSVEWAAKERRWQSCQISVLAGKTPRLCVPLQCCLFSVADCWKFWVC